jgi:hypothetical protein
VRRGGLPVRAGDLTTRRRRLPAWRALLRSAPRASRSGGQGRGREPRPHGPEGDATSRAEAPRLRTAAPRSGPRSTTVPGGSIPLGEDDTTVPRRDIPVEAEERPGSGRRHPARGGRRCGSAPPHHGEGRRGPRFRASASRSEARSATVRQRGIPVRGQERHGSAPQHDGHGSEGTGPGGAATVCPGAPRLRAAHPASRAGVAIPRRHRPVMGIGIAALATAPRSGGRGSGHRRRPPGHAPGVTVGSRDTTASGRGGRCYASAP